MIRLLTEVTNVTGWNKMISVVSRIFYDGVQGRTADHVTDWSICSSLCQNNHFGPISHWSYSPIIHWSYGPLPFPTPTITISTATFTGTEIPTRHVGVGKILCLGWLCVGVGMIVRLELSVGLRMAVEVWMVHEVAVGMYVGVGMFVRLELLVGLRMAVEQK